MRFKKVYTSRATRAISFFEAQPDELKRIKAYSDWLYDINAVEKVARHPLYYPSKEWRNWTQNTFIGFSSNNIMLKSGHFLGHSFFCNIHKLFEKQGTFSILLQLLKLFKHQSSFSNLYDKHKLEKAFLRFYPQFEFPDEHAKFLDYHPIPYLCALEAFDLCGRYTTKHLLEIGAGACMNVNLNYIFSKQRTIVIDLPETVYVGFIMTRLLNPDVKICLPHEVKDDWIADDYDLTFLLPFQSGCIPSNFFDEAVNMSSFQEMDIGVVNNYLSLIKDKLVDGGKFLCVNLDVSRYDSKTNISNYNLEGFNVLKKEYPFFSNWLCRKIKGHKLLLLLAEYQKAT